MTLVEGAIEDEAERMAALAALAELSLVKHDPFEDGAPAVTVHRLVQAVARARSEAKGAAQSASARLIATTCGNLSGRRLSQSRLMAALRATHAASPCELRDGGS